MEYKSKNTTSWALVPIFLLCFFQSAFAQLQTIPPSNMPLAYNSALEAWFYPPVTPGWFEFKPGLVKDCINFLPQHKSAFGFGPFDELRLIKKEKDKMRGNHYLFQQFFKGIKVSGAEILIHEKDGYATNLHGKWVTGLSVQVKNQVTEEDALKVAKLMFPQKYFYVDSLLTKKVAAEQYKPRAELIFAKKDNREMFLPENFRLCFRFLMRPEYGEVSYVFIDCSNKSLLKIQTLEYGQCNTAATAITNFYGNKTFNTKYYAPPNYGLAYYLEDWCTPELTYVWEYSNTTNFQSRIFDNDNLAWNDQASKTTALTSLWACKRSYLSFQTAFGRSGYANQTATLAINQNWNFGTVDAPDYSNASMYSEPGSTYAIMRIGSNGTTSYLDDWNTLDIIGHEYTHAITKQESNLEYVGESGAINESLSDILGTFVEWWDGGSTFDWLLGEDRGGALRDMSNPNANNDPDTYGGLNWAPTGSKDPDNGGVHTNSGVMNFWFYLLTTGGSGVNDNSVTYFVNGIGIEAAALIAYNANCFYMISEDSYVDARMATLMAAKDLYGQCSAAHIAVGDAWHAVGVGGYSPNPDNVCGTEVSNPWVLNAREHINFAAGCTFTVTNTTAIASTYTSSKGMTMYPGFTAATGTNAAFWIVPCNITQYLQPGGIKQQESYSWVQPDPVNPQNTRISVFPNPFTHSTLLTVEQPAEVAKSVLQVFNSHGQLFKEYILTRGRQTLQIDGSRWAAGVYYCKLLTNNKVEATKAIIKQ